MAEQSVKAIRAKLEQYYTHIDKKVDLTDVLPSILTSINTTPVVRTGFTPNEAARPENAGKIYQLKYGHFLKTLEKIRNKFPVKTPVRVAIPDKNVFLKKSKPGFSAEIFYVATVRNTMPTTYIIEDSDGDRLRGYFREDHLIDVGE